MGVSGAEERAAAPTAPVTVEVRQYNGRPTIYRNGVPLALPAYSPVGWSREHYRKTVPYFARHKMGAYFINFPFFIEEGWGSTQVWIGDTVRNKLDAANAPKDRPSLDEQVAYIRGLDPDAYFIVRGIQAWPSNSWIKLHRDQMFVTDSGQVLDAPSLASELFWDGLARTARASLEYIESQPWSERVLGYWVGMFGEGTYPPLYSYCLFDHSPLMTARWREYLEGKYGTVEALRRAFNDPSVRFETIEVPNDPLLGKQQDVAALLYWQDARANQARRDYLELTAQLVHDGYRKIMAAAREGCGGRKLCLYDAFKLPMLGWNLNGFFALGTSWLPAYPEMMSGGGYIHVARLSAAPGFDGVITPHDYQARGVGGVYQPEGMADSAVLRGKLFLCEMDVRTYNIGHTDYGSARNDVEYAAITWRNLADSATRGYWSYWMDLCGAPAGWFGNDSIQKIVARQVEFVRESFTWPHEDVPGIAMVLDDAGVLETNGSGNYLNEAVMWEQKLGIARCGVPYRIYLFEDLALPQFPKHRVFYFPNLFRVDAERLNVLKSRVFRDGNVVVWGPGSGISDGVTVSTASATQLTGFEFDMIAANCPRRALVSNFDHPITRGLPADTIFGGPLPYGPVLFPRVDPGSADTVSLGMAWTKQGRNYSGLAVKSFGRGALGPYTGKEPLGEGDWASVFTTAVPLPANLWRGLARYAGAHVYCDSNDILLADRSVVALHSIQSGEKLIRLPGIFRVTDTVSGTLVAKKTRTIRYRHVAPETRVFHIEAR